MKATAARFHFHRIGERKMAAPRRNAATPVMKAGGAGKGSRVESDWSREPGGSAAGSSHEARGAWRACGSNRTPIARKRTPLSAIGVYWREAGKAEGEPRRKGARS
jgi:hypothetical protein